MNPVTETIKDLLTAGGIGTFAATSGWSIQINMEPTTPVTTISLFNSAGPPPEGCMDVSKARLKSSVCHIRVRASTSLLAQAKIREIIDLLNSKTAFLTESSTIRNMQCSQNNEEFLLEQNDNDQFIWVVDYQVKRRKNA